MSFAGLMTFERNLRTMMQSEAFKRADPAEQVLMGRKLLRSRFGGRLPTLVSGRPKQNSLP